MKLERATTKDIPVLLEIELSTGNDKTYSPMTTEEEWLTEFKDNIIYIIKEKEIPVGLVSYEKKPNDCAYVSGLLIKPPFRGKGFARMVMNTILDELKKEKMIYLVTHPDNVASVNLYKSLGFVEGERKENYFGDGEPRIRMYLDK